MKLATTTGDFAKYTDSTAIAIGFIKEAGFKYVDYSFGTECDRANGVYSKNWKEYTKQLKAYADSMGITFVQGHSPMGAPIVQDNKKILADTIRSVEACGELGIKNLVVHSGYRHKISKEETFRDNKEFFMRVLDVAEKYDVNILVENFNKMCVENMYWIDNAPDLLELIEYVNHPLFHAVWDTGHANMQDMPQNEALKLLGKHVYALHVHDNFGNEDSHMAPYSGSLNFDSLMHGLLDIGYNGYFTFEACNFIQPISAKKSFEADNRVIIPSPDIAIRAEALLYEMGKYILEAYDCFEE